MNPLPDFSNYGYSVLQILKANAIAHRMTYLAIDLNTQHRVVIKQFQFGKLSSDWSAYKAIEREMAVLRQLNHPDIPLYVGSFETPDGVCMVQEYKDAPSLAVPRCLTCYEIKQIAISVLEILVYLQAQVPPVIHRDLKPDNILVDEQLRVYLVDFGFASVAKGERSSSSITAGTLGFMPPEQLYSRPLTPATDLYSLGVTLICLLTSTASSDVETLMNEEGRVTFDPSKLQLTQPFSDWLVKLVQPNPQQRFANAAMALAALKPLSLLRLEPTSQPTTSRPKITGLTQQIATGKPPLLSLLLLCGLSVLASLILFTSQGWTAIALAILGAMGAAFVGAVLGAIAAAVGREFGHNINVSEWIEIAARYGFCLIGIGVSFVSYGVFLQSSQAHISLAQVLLFITGGPLVLFWISLLAALIGSTLERRGNSERTTLITLGLVISLGLSLGFPLGLGVSNTVVTAVAVVLSSLNIVNLIYLPWRRSRLLKLVRVSTTEIERKGTLI